MSTFSSIMDRTVRFFRFFVGDFSDGYNFYVALFLSYFIFLVSFTVFQISLMIKIVEGLPLFLASVVCYFFMVRGFRSITKQLIPGRAAPIFIFVKRCLFVAGTVIVALVALLSAIGNSEDAPLVIPGLITLVAITAIGFKVAVPSPDNVDHAP